jgi:hypothetical protein
MKTVENKAYELSGQYKVYFTKIERIWLDEVYFDCGKIEPTNLFEEIGLDNDFDLTISEGEFVLLIYSNSGNLIICHSHNKLSVFYPPANDDGERKL